MTKLVYTRLWFSLRKKRIPNQFLLDVVILVFVLRYIMSIKIKVNLK